jgi:hypothetical protein
MGSVCAAQQEEANLDEFFNDINEYLQRGGEKDHKSSELVYKLLTQFKPVSLGTDDACPIYNSMQKNKGHTKYLSSCSLENIDVKEYLMCLPLPHENLNNFYKSYEIILRNIQAERKLKIMLISSDNCLKAGLLTKFMNDPNFYEEPNG